MIRDWEAEYPDAWILLEITEEHEGEPVRGKFIAAARDPKDLQKIWKLRREEGKLTMLTYGPPRKGGPAVVVSAA